jgi:hypothetical protein
MSDEHSTEQGDSAADHGHGDDGHGGDGHDVAPLGPVDVAAWGAGVLGIGVALVIAVAFMMATSGVG